MLHFHGKLKILLLISNNTLVAITLVTAESKPDEMEIMINVIMHLLSDNNE